MNKKTIIAALRRAAHTAAQTAIGGIGTAVLIEQVPWLAVLSMTALATVLSLLKSVAVGMPEIPAPADSPEGQLKQLVDADAPRDELQAALDHMLARRMA